jgi:hypothetical protein
MSVHDEDRAFLDRVADSCGLPRKTFELIGNTHVQMQPPTDADYKSVDCALEKLGKAKALNLGFVGNEYYSNEAQ